VTHLGERITPLVDGQLAGDTAERASIHLASCQTCREAVEAERLMKSRLATLGSPQPGDHLVRRLLELAGPDGLEGPLPPRVGHVPGTPRPHAVSPARAGRSPISGPAGRGGSRRPSLATPRGRAAGATRPARERLSRVNRARFTAAMLGAMCLVGAGVAGGVVSAGAQQQPIVPPVDTLVVQHSVSTGILPFGDQNADWEADENVGSGR
jgi:anti-sigma factor RsiW